MFILNFALKIMKLLNSEERPLQVGFGFALGSVIALTPFMSPHNILIFLIICILNVSFPAALLAIVVMAPAGFLLDGVFDGIGQMLLIDTASLAAFWTAFFNLPFVAFSKLNNTVVLGSLVGSLVLVVPIAMLIAFLVRKYRNTWREKIVNAKWYTWFTKTTIYVWGSKIYNFFYGETA